MTDEQPEIQRALAAWTPLAPPAGFAERVVTARADVPARHRRSLVIGGIAVAAAAAAAVIVIAMPGSRAASGTIAGAQRTTTRLGDRGVAVSEPEADLVWKIDDRGAAEVDQRAGNVFYRVEHGGPFVVHTPAGDIRVTGTCFRVEVDAMNTKHKMIASGLTGAAIATAVLVTVYEGHVRAETKTSKADLAAGTRATIASDGRTAILGAIPASELATATREQLIARMTQQQQELAMLRGKLAQTEGGDPRDHDPAWAPEPGRPWFDPSPERLALWATTCHVRVDEPGLSETKPGYDEADRDVAPGEAEAYRAAINEIAKTWKAFVRSLYIEATGDLVGADSLSTESMRHEIEEKSAPGEAARVLYKISHERAGLLAPPTDLSKTSPLERLMRAWVKLGDQSEAAVAKRLGAERAHAIRGDGWGSKSDSSSCPSE